MKNKLVIFIIILLIILLGVTVFIYFNKNNSSNSNEPVEEEEKEYIPQPGEYVPSKMKEILSDKRSIAVVIENSPEARPQTGMSEAYMVYEFVVEGGITRYLAIYKDSNVEKIGPVRSARHHFLNYVLENDSIFVHFGGSTRGYLDITNLNINNMDGIELDGSKFWREKGLYAPHNAMTSIKNIWDYTNKYRQTSLNKGILKYSSNPVILNESEDATNIDIAYPIHKINYVYDSENKVYNRSIDKVADKDRTTGKQITVKNIIVQNVNYSLLTGYGAGNGTKDMTSVGEGTGYYITEGKMIGIKWSKKAKDSKTEYTTLDGKSIILNDGNTYIQMQPTDEKLFNLTPKKVTE